MAAMNSMPPSASPGSSAFQCLPGFPWFLEPRLSDHFTGVGASRSSFSSFRPARHFPSGVACWCDGEKKQSGKSMTNGVQTVYGRVFVEDA